MNSDLLRRLRPARPVPFVTLFLLALLPILLIPMSPVTVPWLGNSAQLSVVSDAAIYGTVAVATAMFAYITGLPSIAQAGLWGIAAYAAAISINDLHISFWLSFPFAIVVAALIAWPTAIVSFRTRGTAFLIVTLAFTEFVVLVLENATNLTGGYNGIAYTGNPSSIGPFQFIDTVPQYYLYLFFLFVAVAVYWLVRRSKLGRRAAAIRDNQDLARSLSLNAYLHRVIVFEISVAVTALAGPLILLQQRVITPDLFNSDEFLSVYLMIMLGGIGTIVGPVIGAWVVELLPQWLSTVAAINPNQQQLLYGVLLILIVLLARQGFVGQVSTMYWQAVRRAARRRAGVSAAATPAAVASEAAGEVNGTAAASVDGNLFAGTRRELDDEVILQTQGLCHNFGANRVLTDLDFDLRAGEIRGLIGPNGSGKTTMLNCVSGFMKPTRGEVLFRGQSLAGRRFEKVSSLGLVRTFQQPEVFVSFTPRQTCELVLSSVGALGCGREYNADMPADPEYFLDLCGLTEVADENSALLPYGQTRLLGVAAALARRPYALMLDEPAAGLGQQDRRKLAEVILGARESGISVLLVDHDMSFLLPLCDRLTVFDYGVKLAEGDPQVVCQEQSVIAAYLGAGFAERHAVADTTGTSA